MKIDFELVKTIAFIVKPRLEVDIECSGMIKRGNEINFKIDLSLVALNGDVSLKKFFYTIKNHLEGESYLLTHCFIIGVAQEAGNYILNLLLMR